MKKKNAFLKDFSKYCIVPICLFTLFKEVIDNVLTTYIVTPILSVCYPPSIKFDIAVACILFTILIPILAKVFKGAKIPVTWVYISLTVFVIYLKYRLPNEPFEFTAISFLSAIKLTDVLSIFLLIVILSYIIKLLIKKFEKENLQHSNEGFAVDEAGKIDVKTDLLNRSKFINEIANKIENTTSKNGSFPIGVVAAWGSGKTTFLNTLLSKFDGKDIITLELNVWKCSNSNQIIETLFKLLKDKLKEYSFSIDNKLQDYTNNLLKGTKNEGLNSVKNLSEIFFPISSIEKQYDSINDEIIKIGKKIVILIDDLDRLDKKEIYEVIRLIRNTANFSNTFFVVAYDRNYILNAIEEINPYQSHLFLEKIFQVEFTLPPIDNKVLQNVITNEIEKFLSPESLEGYKEVLETNFAFFDERSVNLTSNFILNLRDAVRFINSFKLSYGFVRDEVYFPDFYNLELIRFKHPEIFTEIYRNFYQYFTTENERTSFYNTESSTFCLKIKKDAIENPQNVSELELFLKKERAIYKLNTKDITTIVRSYAALFPQKNSMYQANNKALNSHLSVVKPSMFERYFLLGIEGKLSEIEFSKMRQLPLQQFKEKLTEICKNQNLLIDLSERFEEIKEFDTKEDFEKIIAAIFHFANLPHPNKEHNSRLEQIQYNGKSLASILGSERNLRFYNNDKEEYKELLFKFLKTDNLSYTYTNDFVSYLLHDIYNDVSNILSREEISEILLHNFTNAIGKADKLSVSLWWHFMRCECREEVPAGGGGYHIKYPRNKKALSPMRRFVCEKDLDGFMEFSIRETHYGKKFTLEGTLAYVFKSNELFIQLLKRYKGTSLFKEEFLNFYEALTTNVEFQQEGVPKDFFKIIPVKYRNE